MWGAALSPLVVVWMMVVGNKSQTSTKDLITTRTKTPSSPWLQQPSFENHHAATATAAFAAALLTATAFPPAAFAADASANIQQGSVLFQANCAGCHAGGANYVSEKKTLYKDAIEKYRGTVDQAKIQNFVQNGMPHRMMPFKFTDQEYLDVTTFVLDQALNEKW